MAARTATRKPAKPVVREETAKVVVDETSTSETTGRLLAEVLVADRHDADGRIYDLARIAFGGIATGAKPNEIAKATTKAVAESFPVHEREWAEATSVVNGGAKVSRVTITQRSDAWGSILSAGIAAPTTDLVVTAFRKFTSKGAPGLAEAHKELIKATLALPEGEREAHYLVNAPIVSKAVTDRKKGEADEKKGESSAKAAADKKSEDTSEVVELDDVATVIALIRAEVARPWSDDDRATLMAALSEIVEA